MHALKRPRAWSVLLALAAIALFVWLGLWQLDRASQKEQLMRRYAAAQAAPVQPYRPAAAQAPLQAYPRLWLQGRLLVDRVYLLDNPRHDQRGGVEVYVPIRPLDDDRMMLADLGFLPGDGSGRMPQLPALPQQPLRLQGSYRPPPGVGWAMGGDALARQASWPKSTTYLDLDQLAADLGGRLYPGVLVLDPSSDSPYQRSSLPDLSAMPPARHRAYALQWFSFALAVVVIFIVLHRQPRGRRASP